MKRFAWYRSVTFKFTASMILAAVIVTTVAAYVNIKMRNREYIHDLGVWAYHLGQIVKNATRNSMMADRSHELQFMLESIASSQAWIEKVSIFNPEGIITYSSEREDIGKHLNKESRECISCHQSESPPLRLPQLEDPQLLTSSDGSRKLLSSVVPILNEPGCAGAPCHVHPASQRILGVLDLILPLDELGQRISAGTTRLIVLAVISILCISLIISVLTQNQIIRPIKRLLEGTEHVAEGDFDHTLPIYSRDELGALSKAFNKMTRELGSHDRDLKRWVVTLEDKVQERTRELEDARIRLVQQEKMASLGRLAAGVAHEINNPMTSILVFGSMLQDRIAADHPDYKKVSTIVSQTLRCREIVERLLVFSRQEKPRKEKQSINQAIREAYGLLKNQAIFQNIRVHMKLVPSLPAVSMDANEIQQVFFNIMINAADAMPVGGDLTVRSYQEPFSEAAFVVCEFEDTGQGIPAEDLPRLFEPFFSTKAKGTGLGLSICYGIIQRHEGKIEVKSKKNKGSVFVIRLPIS